MKKIRRFQALCLAVIMTIQPGMTAAAEAVKVPVDVSFIEEEQGCPVSTGSEAEEPVREADRETATPSAAGKTDRLRAVKDTEPNYLTFTAEQADSSVTFKYCSGTDVMYKKNDGEWTNCEPSQTPAGDKVSLPNVGDTVMFRGTEVKTDGNYHFSVTGKVAATGSVTSLTDQKGNDPDVSLTESCYQRMFYGCTGLTSAPELPAAALSDYCYSYMFDGCTGLTSAPELPAAALSDYCYSGMFDGCTGLTSAPELPAATLSDYCYSSMFEGCTGLTSAPELPAAVLSDYCYSHMFCGCTGLTSAPELPAASVAYGCYCSMFRGCTGLSAAPELPAADLDFWCYSCMFEDCTGLTEAPELPAMSNLYYCYYGMFKGCTGLTEAPELPATTLGFGCYSYMFSGCTGLTAVPDLPATKLAMECYEGMFKDCTGLSIRTASDPSHTKMWILPDATIAKDWNKSMFEGCTRVDFVEPSVNTTYFQRSVSPMVVTSGDYIGTYDGAEHTGTVSVLYPADGYTVKYGTREGTYSLTTAPTYRNAGEYVVYYKVTAENYDTEAGSFTVSIGKASYDMSGVGFTSKTEPYDGTPKSLLITGTLPAGVSVNYAGNNKTECGVYPVVAKFTGDVTNYYSIPDKSATLTIKKLKVTVSFDANGGTVSPESREAVYAEPYGELPTPVRKGYSFVRWSTSAGGTAAILSGTPVNKKTDHKLYAVWSADKYTITYELNSGTNSDKNPLYYYITTATVTLADPTRKGYTFAGWYSDEKFKTKVIEIRKGSTGAKTFYAKWTKTKFSVTYELNSGTNSDKNPSYYYITTATVTLADPTRKGYTFAGWYSDSKFKTKVTEIRKGSTGAKTFYAKWTANRYTIRFNANGGKGTMKDLTGIAYDTSKVLTVNAFKRTGYTFAGWALSRTGGVKYKDKASVKNLSSGNGAAVTLYAVWTANAYTVRFNGNGATSGSMASLSKKYDDKKALTSNTFKRKGYTFTGWNTKADGSGTKYADKDKSNIRTTAGTSTLYARWKKTKYSVTYVLNGGTNSDKNPSYYYITTATVTLAAPTRKGYTFAGWYSDEKFKTKVTEIRKGSTGTKTFYAKWKKK